MSSLQERFDAKWVPEPNSGCWLWTGAISGIRPSMGMGKSTDLAYRVSWRMHKGDIPNGLYVCHRCDVPMCVNPEHLFLGTQADNLSDMSAKNRGHGACSDRTNAQYKVKLTDVDVIAIRSSDRSGRALAAQFGVSQPMIAAIKRRSSWRHI